MTTSDNAALDAACLTAHAGAQGATEDGRLLVAVFGGGVAHELLLMGARLGYRIALLDPDESRVAESADRIPGLVTATNVEGLPALDHDTDVVMTDHHREELGPVLRDLLGTSARWIGLMGNPRHEGPHIAALTSLGVDGAQIERVHRPIGLNIGSHTPAEIAISALAGLLADRAGRPGGFHFS